MAWMCPCASGQIHTSCHAGRDDQRLDPRDHLGVGDRGAGRVEVAPPAAAPAPRQAHLGGVDAHEARRHRLGHGRLVPRRPAPHVSRSPGGRHLVGRPRRRPQARLRGPGHRVGSVRCRPGRPRPRPGAVRPRPGRHRQVHAARRDAQAGGGPRQAGGQPRRPRRGRVDPRRRGGRRVRGRRPRPGAARRHLRAAHPARPLVPPRAAAVAARGRRRGTGRSGATGFGVVGRRGLAAASARLRARPVGRRRERGPGGPASAPPPRPARGWRNLVGATRSRSCCSPRRRRRAARRGGSTSGPTWSPSSATCSSATCPTPRTAPASPRARTPTAPPRTCSSRRSASGPRRSGRGSRPGRSSGAPAPACTCTT